MRHTGPVTQTEHLISPERCLVSTTDLKGRITYCNPAFIEASGYAREELLGKPHNLIRHPDMPAEAFRDMWATIASGRPWSALVKNRRKNGDHYWVRANVTPLMEGDAPIGYMSVRGVPDRQAVAAAEALYRRMNDATAQGVPTVRFAAGRAVLPGWKGRAAPAIHWLRTRGPLLGAGALTLAGFGLGALLPGAFGAALAVGLGAACAAIARHHLERPLRGLLKAARRMAAGDLRQHIEVDALGLAGELQVALAQLNVNLQSIVGDARQEVNLMQDSIREIAEGNLDMSERTESQASNLEQTAASMEEITGTVRQGADTAREAAVLADAVTQETDASTQAVLRVSDTMHGIGESSRRIGDISGVIDSIAFQTNLLALNAAVEAARVGEQGKGFGVVAAEVRSLAQRTAEAAREIRGLVHSAQGHIESGVKEADAAASTIRHTAESVTRVARLMQEISHGASEQLTGISQVNDAVSHLDGITQHNATMVEQLSASASSLRQRADIVADSVRVFHTA